MIASNKSVHLKTVHTNATDLKASEPFSAVNKYPA